MPTRTGLRVIAAFALTIAFAGCTTRISGTSAPAATLASSGASPTSTAAKTSLATDLCTLLDWPDLKYPGTDKAKGPTKTGQVKEWQQSCEWQSQQFKAGYQLPPEAPRSNFPPGLDGDSQAIAAEAQRIKSIEENSVWVTVMTAWNHGQPTTQPDKYDDAGHTVYLARDNAESSCTLGTTWAGGVLAVQLQDPTNTFGAPCDQAKKVMTLLIQREPH